MAEAAIFHWQLGITAPYAMLPKEVLPIISIFIHTKIVQVIRSKIYQNVTYISYSINTNIAEQLCRLKFVEDRVH